MRNQKRNIKTGKYGKGEKAIHDIEIYETFRYLEKCKKTIINLKADLKRECIPYYKYDDCVKDIERYQKLLIEKDKLKELT
jgi:hypothetical protein